MAGAWAVGISIPASAAAPVKGFLEIVSVTDTGTPSNPGSGLGAPVQDRPFSVVVRVLDTAGQATTVNQATTVVLEEAIRTWGSGGTDNSGYIPRNGSGATISGATYSQFANGVVLRVRAVSGVELGLDPETNPATVEVALKAVGANATPGNPLNLTDPDCAAPTEQVPTCGQLLLPNGASGLVTVSVGSCDGLVAAIPDHDPECLTVDDTKALVVTTIANFKDADGKSLYETSHATLILACDKVLCGQSGVPKLPVIYTLENTGQLDTEAPACSAKGVLPEGPNAACVDYVSSMRSHGDLYLVVLFRPRRPLERVAQRRTRAPAPGRRPATRGLRPGVSVLRGRPRGAVCLTRWPTELRQRHPDYAQQLEGLASLFGEPVCVGLIVLACDAGSHGEQESALVRGIR